jgi:hypothetical protein
MMIVSKKFLRDMVEGILSAVIREYFNKIETEFDRIEAKLVRLSKSIQPVVAQVTVNTTDAFYASSLGFLVPGESRELAMSVYSDVPSGAILRLNDDHLVIVECKVGNVIQAMTENTSSSEVILKAGVRVGTIVCTTVLYPAPVSVE